MRSSILLYSILSSLTLLILFGISCTCNNAPTAVVAVQKPEDRYINQFLKHYTSMFQTQMDASSCPGAAVAIVKDSTIIFLHGFGKKTMEGNDTVDVNSMFRIGSLSKGFAAVLTGILVEKGQLNWDDRVIDYLPDFAFKNQEQAERIKIANLLSHSTGLPRHTFSNMLEDGISITDARLKLDEVELLGEEGKVFAYQNLAYSIIEEIILKKTGKTYNELLQEYIFSPAQMSLATFTYDDLMKCDNKCSPHVHGDEAYMSVPLNNKYYNAVSVGGINASISDMANWLKVLLGERKDMVADSTLKHIFTPFIQTPGHDYYDQWDGLKSSYYGMGFRILDYGNKKLIYHAGSVNDFRSEIALDLENNIGICVLFNAQNSMAKHVVPTFFNYYEMYKECVH